MVYNHYKPKRIDIAFESDYIKRESNDHINKNLSIKEYLNMIKAYLSNTINDHKNEWNIQLSMRINFVPSIVSEDSNKPRIMYTNSDDVVIMIGYETNEIIEKLFKSLLKRYQQGLEEKMGEGSNYVFHSVDLLHYRLYEISLNRGGSYIDSPKWLKNKKTIINPKNKDDKCFQYAITVALNYKYIILHLLLISMIGLNRISITQKTLE